MASTGIVAACHIVEGSGERLLRRCAGALPLAACVFLAACGGGGGGSSSSSSGTSASTLVGYLVDAPVSGISYSTSSGIKGTTVGDGSFSYASGDTVSFTALGINLSQAAGNAGAIAIPSGGIVTPFTLANETVSSDATQAPKSAAIASFLQTLSNLSSGSDSAATDATLVMPAGTTASALATTLGQQQAGTGSTLIQTIAANLPTLVGNSDAALVVGQTTAIDTAAQYAQAALASQTSAGLAWAGSVWQISGCSNGACNLSAVLQSNGTIAGVNIRSRSTFGGYWSASGGSLSIYPQGSMGSASVTLSAGATSSASLTLYQGGAIEGTATITEITGPGGAATATNGGAWFASNTNASGEGAALVLAPDGSVVGVSYDRTDTQSGTWSGSSATVTGSDGTSCTLNLSALTGSCSKGSTSYSLTLGRQASGAPVGAAQYAGIYNGTYSIDCALCDGGNGESAAGTVVITVSNDGSFTTIATVTSHSNVNGDNYGANIGFQGTVTSSGIVQASSTNNSNGCQNFFASPYTTGQISGTSLSVSYTQAASSANCPAVTGSISATLQ